IAPMFSACAPTLLQPGSLLNIALTDNFNSLNADNVTGDASLAVNEEVSKLINPSFFFTDANAQLAANEKFGAVEILSESPFKVRYSLTGSAKWSDGVPVSARDLMLSWLAARNPIDAGFNSIRSGSGLRFANQTPVISADSKSIDITFDRPVADWQTAITITAAAHLVAQNAFAADAVDASLVRFDQAIAETNLADQKLLSEKYSQLYLARDGLAEAARVSAGAYVVESFQPNQSLTLKVNATFSWGPEPKIETLNIKFYSDSTAMLSAIQDGEVDIAAPQESGIASNSDLINLARAAGARYEFAASNSIEAVLLNFGEASVFSDSESGQGSLLRDAFLKLIPRAKILAALSVDNPVIEAKSWFYSNASSYYAPFVQSNGSSEYLVQAAERAEEIIEASDLRTPIDVRVLFDSNNPRAKAEWSLLSEYAAQTGFNLIDVSAKDPRTVFSTGEFDAYITTVRLASEVGGDPYWFTGNSVGQFENANIDALLAKYAAETKPLNQISVLKDIDAELYAAKFGLPLYQVPSLLVYADRLTSVVKAPYGASATYGYWNWVVGDK
ncbi:MAG: ABC transporter substrate-binding protein, partial [Rhodoluna sp.]